MRHSTLAMTAAALVAVACSGSTTGTSPAADSQTSPAISIEKSVYSVAELGPGSVGVHATLVTTSADRPYYSRLGDAFNGAVDQNPLYVAEGSDASLERQTGATWTKATGGILVEGVREVVISPGKTYTLLANLSSPIQTGTYRLTVVLRQNSGGPESARITSPTFEIR